MITFCIAVIVILGRAGGLTYEGESHFLIEIPTENRNESMCRNESLEQATEDLKSGDITYCPGMKEFTNLLRDPTDETAIGNFIYKLMNESVYGAVIENFTLTNNFSDSRNLLETIWFHDNFNGSSLFKKVFVHNEVKDVVRINSFGSYLYHSVQSEADFLYQPAGQMGCNNDTEVPMAACFNSDPPLSIVYLPNVNPLFDMTVFTLAAMMGKVIDIKTTQRNLTFVVRHPDDKDCFVPLTVLYKKVNMNLPTYFTYKDINSIYYNYHAEDGTTNTNVCYEDIPGIIWNEDGKDLSEYDDASVVLSKKNKNKAEKYDKDEQEKRKKFKFNRDKKKAFQERTPRKKRVG